MLLPASQVVAALAALSSGATVASLQRLLSPAASASPSGQLAAGAKSLGSLETGDSQPAAPASDRSGRVGRQQRRQRRPGDEASAQQPPAEPSAAAADLDASRGAPGDSRPAASSPPMAAPSAAGGWGGIGSLAAGAAGSGVPSTSGFSVAASPPALPSPVVRQALAYAAGHDPPLPPALSGSSFCERVPASALLLHAAAAGVILTPSL